MSTNILVGKFYMGMVFTLLLFAVVLSFQAVAEHGEKEDAAGVPLLVDADWLASHLDDPKLVVIDTRTSAEYEKGHIVEALNLPSTNTYKAAPENGVISQRRIEEILGGLGIDHDTHVVVYGDATYLNAARVFWTLDLFGHTSLSLLNGAYPAWERSGQPVDTRIPAVTTVDYQAIIQPGKMATRLQILLAIENPRIAIVDVREADHFQGLKSKASRFGHIPSAINIPKNRNLEVRQGIYYLKSTAAFKKLYADIESYAKVILYCNTGSEAAIAYLALSLLEKDVSVYDGAWQEWGNATDLPIISPMP